MTRWREYSLRLGRFVRKDALAIEARQGGDGATRLHRNDENAGRKATPNPAIPSHIPLMNKTALSRSSGRVSDATE